MHVAPGAAECKVLDPELRGFYQGGCKKGLAHGRGNARGTAEYEGEFRNGLKHGRGVKRWPWGDRYEGEFVQDRRHGRGEYVWGTGSPWAGERYEGEFRNDQRDGFGTYFWPNGDRFEGQWRNDQRLGLSVMEQRRELARKVRAEVLRVPGKTVCGVMEVGIAHRTMLRGETQGLDEGRLKVKVTAISEAAHGLRPPVEIGTIISAELWDWEPCS